MIDFKIEAFIAAQSDPSQVFAGYHDALDCYIDLVNECDREMEPQEFAEVICYRLAPAFDLICNNLSIN